MPRFLVDFFPNVANYWDIFLTALNATYQMFFIAGLYHTIDRRCFWNFVDCNKDRWDQTESSGSLYFRSHYERI